MIPEGASELRASTLALSMSGQFDESQGTRTTNDLDIGNDTDIASDTDLDPDCILEALNESTRYAFRSDVSPGPPGLARPDHPFLLAWLDDLRRFRQQEL